MTTENHIQSLSNALKRLSPEKLAEIKEHRQEALHRVCALEACFENHGFENDGDE